MLHYCKKCGRMAQESYTRKEQLCDCCKAVMHPVPQKYLLEGYDSLYAKKRKNIQRTKCKIFVNNTMN